MQSNKIPKWDKRFIDLATLVGSWSKDPSSSVGAVIVDKHHRIISVGYNGYPRGIADDDLHDREKKYAKVIHAEQNAILFARRSLECTTLYVTHFPCSSCSSLIVQVGIRRVVCSPMNEEFLERWKESIQISTDIFAEAGVFLTILE